MWGLLDDGFFKLVTELIIIIVLFFGGWLKKNRMKVVEYLTKKSILKQKSDLKENKEIKKELIELRKDLNADRVLIYQFHNGDYYINNSSILKMSVSFEDCNNNLVPIMDELQNMLVSKYPNLLFDILEKDYLAIEDIEQTYDRYEISHELNYREVEKFYGIKLVDKNDKFIGILTVSYLNPEKAISFDSNILLDYSRRITYLLDKKKVG